jgi:predicted Zn-dependent protease
MARRLYTVATLIGPDSNDSAAADPPHEPYRNGPFCRSLFDYRAKGVRVDERTQTGLIPGGSAMRVVISILAPVLIALAFVGNAFTQSETPPLSGAEDLIIGKKLREAFLAVHPLTQDGNLLVRVDEIGRRVAKFGDRPDLTYYFLVVSEEQIQAYSIPGGTVCVTEALARLLDDNELAFVLGHEVAHLALRHHTFKMRLQDAVDGGPKKLHRLVEELKSHFDRQWEEEADRYGALYAMRADFHFSATHAALKKMKASEEPDEDVAHPEYAHRIAALNSYERKLKKALESFKLGLNALKTGEVGEAIGYFDIFVAEFPSSVAGRVNRGAAHLARVRPAKKLPVDLAEVLPILPKIDVILRSGTYKPRDLEFARHDFEQALRIDPDEAMARAGLALVSMRTGDLEQAKRQLNWARSTKPDSAEILLCLGNVEFLLGDYHAAEQLDLEALALRPEWPSALWNLALAYQQQGRIDEARNLWLVLSEDGLYKDEASKRIEQLKAALEN